MQHFSSLSSIQTLFSSSGSANNNRTSLQTMHCSPLDERAMIWRAQSNQINEFKNKILSQEADISELKRGLKLKIDEVSEMQIRRDIAEKKLSTALKDTSKLQEELERLTKEFKEKEAEKEKTLNKYNQEINELYSDHRLMKEKLKGFSKNAMMGKMSSPLNLISSDPPSPISNLSSKYVTASTPNQFDSSNSSATIANVSAVSSQLSQNKDVAELQQQIFDLRTAMKRLANRNSELRLMLSKVPTSNSTQLATVKPQWYFDTLKQIKDSERNKEQRLQELKLKLMDFKYDVMRYRCGGSLLHNTDRLLASRKPGWSRCIGELIRKENQLAKLQDAEFYKRFSNLRSEVEQFVRSFDDGFSCDSTYASFLAPHITKVICFNLNKNSILIILFFRPWILRNSYMHVSHLQQTKPLSLNR